MHKLRPLSIGRYHLSLQINWTKVKQRMNNGRFSQSVTCTPIYCFNTSLEHVSARRSSKTPTTRHSTSESSKMPVAISFRWESATPMMKQSSIYYRVFQTALSGRSSKNSCWITSQLPLQPHQPLPLPQLPSTLTTLPSCSWKRQTSSLGEGNWQVWGPNMWTSQSYKALDLISKSILLRDSVCTAIILWGWSAWIHYAPTSRGRIITTMPIVTGPAVAWKAKSLPGFITKGKKPETTAVAMTAPSNPPPSTSNM